MNFECKVGLVHNVSVRDNNGNLKTQTKPLFNHILNGSANVFSNGFSDIPIPDLGNSTNPVSLTDTGVVSPIPTSHRIVLESPILVNSELGGEGSYNLYQWQQTYEYTYSGSGDMLAEIGISNFSRAVITDIDDQPLTIELKNGDIVTLVTVFSMLVNRTSGTMTVNNPFIETPTQPTVDYNINPVTGVVGNNWYRFFATMSVQAETNDGVQNCNLTKTTSQRKVSLAITLNDNPLMEEISKLILAIPISNNFVQISFPVPLEFIATQNPSFTIDIEW